MSVGITGAAIIGGGLAGIGGIAGALGRNGSQDQKSWVDLGASGGFDSYLGGTPGYTRNTLIQNPKYAGIDQSVLDRLGITDRAINQTEQVANQPGAIQQMYGQLNDFTNMGPGGSDITAATGANRDLAAMLEEYSKNGNMPTSADISRGSDLSKSLYGAEQTGLDQSFIQQTTEANRQAARLGRGVDDPILQAKLRTGMMQQQAMLDAKKGAWATQYSMGQPGERLGYAQQRTGILSGLASQAFQNRSTMLSMGNQLLNAERQWRVTTGTKYGQGNESVGGGLGGALTGFVGGLGAGMTAYGRLSPGSAIGAGGSPSGGSSNYDRYGMGTGGGGPTNYDLYGMGTGG